MLSSLDLCIRTKFVPVWLRFAGVILERLIFQTKSLQYWLEALGLSHVMRSINVRYLQQQFFMQYTEDGLVD